MANVIRRFLFGGPGAETRFGDVGLLILRVGAGGLMAYAHGLSKVWGDGSVRIPGQLIDGVKALGFPAPTAFAWAAALTEFLGGILLALGLFTRPVALALTFNMAVAAFMAHRADPIDVKEKALLYLMMYQVFIFTGAGRFSIDRFLRKPGAPPRGFPAHD